MKRGQRYAPVHPGEILDQKFLREAKLSQYRLAQALGVPRRRINEIVLGQRSITADTALRLSRYFGTSPEFWLSLQATYDLEVERDRMGESLAAIKTAPKSTPSELAKANRILDRLQKQFGTPRGKR